MIDVRDSWAVDVERGPDWLLIKPQGPPDAGQPPALADWVWSLVERHFVYRVVLECDSLHGSAAELVEQLTALYERIVEHQGALRLCGLSNEQKLAIQQCSLAGRLACYADRDAAIRMNRPTQPR